MSSFDAFLRWLGELGEADLAALLKRRSDVLLGAQPRDLRELAQRLWHPASLATVLRESSVPCLQLVEAAQALGDGCTRAALAGLLDGAGSSHLSEVDRVTKELIECAVITPRGPDRLALPEALAHIFARPLGLDEPLAVLLRDRPIDAMRRILTVLGIGAGKSRAAAESVLAAHLGDPATVGELMQDAPEGVAQYLTVLAGPPSMIRLVGGSEQFRHRQAAIQWGGERGLLIGQPWGWDWRMPAEVALALRGPEYRAPFNPCRPTATTRRVDHDCVERDSAAAATDFAGHVGAVLDHLARIPVATLKSGGVGARVLAKLAKTTAAGEVEVRLVLELADELGLLTRSDQALVVSEEFAEWRELDPGDRFAAVLSAWWGLGSTPSESRDADGKALHVLTRDTQCADCRGARVVLLDTVADLDGATSCAAAASVALWRRPLVHIAAQDEDDPLASVWHEAEMLGVIADGALTGLGRALRAGCADDLAKRAGALLPQTADRATFGSDLTGYVIGAPSARVSALLDATADRESRGGATTWRFSPASVRRAMDEGISGDELLAALTTIATGALPQPLRYLVADVMRRHGVLRVAPSATCIHSEDAALLAEVAADRKLAKFGLRLLAPTVLVSDVEPTTLLDALRVAGYFPVAETSTGVAVWGRGGPSRSSERIRELHAQALSADPRASATRLRRTAGEQRPEADDRP